VGHTLYRGSRLDVGEMARQYLREPFPGMTLIGVKELAWPDLMVELQAIVGIPRKDRGTGSFLANARPLI
jgi:hypothetical protein